MARKTNRWSFYDSRDQYVDELLEAGRRELEELQKDPDEREDRFEKHRKEFMQQEMTRSERFHIVLGAIGAGLVIAGIFLVAMFLFLLFCTKVWLA